MLRFIHQEEKKKAKGSCSTFHKFINAEQTNNKFCIYNYKPKQLPPTVIFSSKLAFFLSFTFDFVFPSTVAISLHLSTPYMVFLYFKYIPKFVGWVSGVGEPLIY